MAIRWGRQGHDKRSSEQDIALVQMQIASQARNQKWHEYLCEKREELQARLRQQGYSQRAGRESHVADRYRHGSEMDNVSNMAGETEVDAAFAEPAEHRSAKTVGPGENNGDAL